MGFIDKKIQETIVPKINEAIKPLIKMSKDKEKEFNTIAESLDQRHQELVTRINVIEQEINKLKNGSESKT